MFICIHKSRRRGLFADTLSLHSRQSLHRDITLSRPGYQILWAISLRISHKLMLTYGCPDAQFLQLGKSFTAANKAFKVGLSSTSARLAVMSVKPFTTANTGTQNPTSACLFCSPELVGWWYWTAGCRVQCTLNVSSYSCSVLHVDELVVELPVYSTTVDVHNNIT